MTDATGSRYTCAMHDHEHDEVQTAEVEATIAERVLLVDRDPAHALHHLANALFESVGEDTYFALAMRLLAVAPVETLFTASENNDRRLTAKAVLLHLERRDAEALPLLSRVAVYRPDRPFERWLAPWITEATEPLDPDAFSRYLMIPARSTVGRIALRPSEVRHAAAIADVADALLERSDTRDGPNLLASASGVYRRAGRLTRAIEVAERSAYLGNRFAFTMLALAKRASKDLHGARVAFEQAFVDLPDPENAEFGRLAWDRGDFAEALEVFEAEAKGGPRPEMDVAVDWLRYAASARRTQGAPTQPRGAGAPSDAERRGEELEVRVGRPLVPDDTRLLPMAWIGWLPEPNDAIVNGAREALASGTTLSRVASTSLEAPSARLAVAWAISADDIGALPYEARVPTNPDPREPWEDVPFVLYRYDDLAPIRGLERPGTDVLDAIASLARRPYYLPTWWSDAEAIARGIGPDRVRELAAGMVHARRSGPPDMPPWVWLARQQLAAALLIARVEDKPTVGGPAWTTLEAILCGPSDWAVEAAIVAAAELALEHPPLEPLVRTTLELLFENAPREGHVSWLDALATIYPRLPRASGPWLASCAEHWQPKTQG